MSVCSECHGGCCRRYYIDLTGYDIFKIHNLLELDYDIFATPIEVTENIKDEVSKDAALFKFSDKKNDVYYRFTLTRIESHLAKGTSKCMFLQEWDSETLKKETPQKLMGRCGIYSARPLMCANYPARFDLTGLFGYVLDPYLNAEKKQTEVYNVCPRKLTKEDFADYSGEINKNLALRKFELEYFQKLAKEWNENPKTENELFDFIDKIYTNRISYDESI